jgi:uncharacterized protein (TIGR04255 family)
MFNLVGSMRIPKKITPSPVKDVIAEIRYKDAIASEIFAGTIYGAFKDKYDCQFQRLPINDTPIALREANPLLKYQAHYVIDIGDVTIRISLASVSVAINCVYNGWEWYYNFVKEFIETLQGLQLINSLERLGLRYSSFFSEDISDKIKVSIKIADFDIKEAKAKNYVRTEWNDSKITYILQISNNVILNENNTAINGSLIDIDVSANFEDLNFSIEDCKELLIEFHEKQKKIFFNILKQEFLNSLQPEYENAIT